MALAEKYNEEPERNGFKWSDHFIIKIPDDYGSFWPEECCIHQIPRNLRDLNDAAYTPQFISIGPIHHGKPELANMEKYKYLYLQKFLARTEKKLETFADFIKDREESIRRKYSEPFKNLDSKDYATMILLDAFFIFELFLGTDDENAGCKNDCVLQKAWLKTGIQHDLMLLENQLPYSDLANLYTFAFPDDPKRLFYPLAGTYFSNYNPNRIILQEKGILHFTDMIRGFMSQTLERKKPSSRIKNLKVPAKKLSEAGIKFERVENGNLADVDFCKGILKLPQFEAHDTTELVFRNVMALEQSEYPNEAYITSYILLMDFLINSNKDVAFLVERGIVTNGLGSCQAVADMINKLCRNITETNFHFQDICDDLNKFCESWWHKVAAIWNGEYFKDVWHGTGTIFGFILVLLTFINSICSILAVIYG
ncbi:UPF0481 protein At3g47200-like [Rutidosis leptorrhynchoides]|uniref:UPF0481 protein At3g47200-like n=1 Tax=Rutidosis leptorrhynchoides TaxID=125765 RepID=UPI003A9A2B8B